MAATPDKASLRPKLKQARLALSDKQVAAHSAVIVDHLKQLLKELKPRVVHCFEPISGKHEVDVTSILTFLQSQRPSPELYTSRKESGWWQVVLLDGQPVYPLPQFDCVIVPMLGFDEHSLHRLGNGGGYYDRLLSVQPTARKIGVCFELGNVKDLPSEPFDIPLDVIVTERKIYRR